MIWYELTEDLGDGSSTTRRFRTEAEAGRYWELNINWIRSETIEVVDTDSPWFFDEVVEEDER